LYEYVAVYVDDQLIAAQDPEEITGILEESHNIKLKGVGHLTYHLGCDYFCDRDGTLCYGPWNYIGEIMDQFEHILGYNPKEYTSSPEKGEIDVTDELDEYGIKKFQTMIGCLQWAVYLGRFTYDHVTIQSSTKDWTLESFKKDLWIPETKLASASIHVRLLEPRSWGPASATVSMAL
jgi:hypothetical protein